MAASSFRQRKSPGEPGQGSHDQRADFSAARKAGQRLAACSDSAKPSAHFLPDNAAIIILPSLYPFHRGKIEGHSGAAMLAEGTPGQALALVHSLGIDNRASPGAQTVPFDTTHAPGRPAALP